jgi:hypothetical protein
MGVPHRLNSDKWQIADIPHLRKTLPIVLNQSIK